MAAPRWSRSPRARRGFFTLSKGSRIGPITPSSQGQVLRKIIPRQSRLSRQIPIDGQALTAFPGVRSSEAFRHRPSILGRSLTPAWNEITNSRHLGAVTKSARARTVGTSIQSPVWVRNARPGTSLGANTNHISVAAFPPGLQLDKYLRKDRRLRIDKTLQIKRSGSGQVEPRAKVTRGIERCWRAPRGSPAPAGGAASSP